MTTTSEQKAALDQLFDEVYRCGFDCCNEGTLRPGEASFHDEYSKAKFLRTTFADRVAEILKPKEGEG